MKSNLPLKAVAALKGRYALPVMALTAGVGVVAVFLVFAAGPFVMVELENGTLSGSASVANLSGASGGKVVQFGTAATPTPTPTPAPTPTPTAGPRSCGGNKPTASCTGVTPGVALTIVNGDVTYGPSYNGQTISGKDFRGLVKITGANITIKDSIFRGRANMNFNAGILDTDGSTGTITVMDVEVDNSANPSVWIDGMWLKNTNVYRAHIHHGVVDGIKTFGNVLIEESYIHDMKWFASDPNQGGGATHNDGVQSWAGLANTTLRRNNIDMSTTQSPNAAWQNSSPNSLAEGNWLDGGACTLNFSHAGQPTLQPMYVRNNRFGRNRYYTDCVILISTQTVLTQYSGNVWDDTGAPAPGAQQHD